MRSCASRHRPSADPISICSTGTSRRWSQATCSAMSSWARSSRPAAGIYGYSHITGGYAGGQAQYARVPFADVGPLKIENDLSDEQVLFLSDILPTGYMGAEFCEIGGGEVVAVFGAGPVGQFAIASAVLLGAQRVIAIDQYDYRLAMARNRAGATDIVNFSEDADIVEQLKLLSGGRGPDAVIDCVGMEASHGHGALHTI